MYKWKKKSTLPTCYRVTRCKSWRSLSRRLGYNLIRCVFLLLFPLVRPPGVFALARKHGRCIGKYTIQYIPCWSWTEDPLTGSTAVVVVIVARQYIIIYYYIGTCVCILYMYLYIMYIRECRSYYYTYYNIGILYVLYKCVRRRYT